MPFAARRATPTVHVGNVAVGSCHPIVVQSMTNTDTADVTGTVRQVAELARAGSELVRVTVNNEDAARAVPAIVEGLDRIGVHVPIIGDFHYNGHLLLTRHPDCASALAKFRINPGNVGGKHADTNFRAIIEVALAHDKPVRIGVNWGSLDQLLLTELMDANALLPAPRDARDVTMEAMVQSAVRSAAFAESVGMARDRIILSAKVSGVQDLIDVYRMLAGRSAYPLHLGLTEAGMGAKGIVASAAGLAVLLQEGIGDTIRVSLTPAPGGDRAEEVRVAQQILQSLELRSFTPQVTSCPGCGRTTSTFFQHMAQDIEGYLRQKMPVWSAERPGVEEMKVAVMGCVVNGPGESKHANIGISLPGTFEEPKAPVYVDGKLFVTLKGDRIVPEFLEILENYVAARYGVAGRPDRGRLVRRPSQLDAECSPCRDAPRAPPRGPPAPVRRGPADQLHALRLSHDPHHRRVAGRRRRGRPPAAGTRGHGRALCPRRGAGVRDAWTGGRTHRVDFRRDQQQQVGAPPHGQPAARVGIGPAGRLYDTDVSGVLAWAARFSAERPYGAFMMGATSGLVAAPCGAPAFAAVLTFVAATGSAVLGFTYLLAFSLGMTAVLAGVGIFAGAVTALPRSGAWLLWVKRAGGVLLLVMAEYYPFQAGRNS